MKKRLLLVALGCANIYLGAHLGACVEDSNGSFNITTFSFCVGLCCFIFAFSRKKQPRRGGQASPAASRRRKSLHPLSAMVDAVLPEDTFAVKQPERTITRDEYIDAVMWDREQNRR